MRTDPGQVFQESVSFLTVISGGVLYIIEPVFASPAVTFSGLGRYQAPENFIGAPAYFQKPAQIADKVVNM